MKYSFLSVLILCAAILCVVPAVAHHSFASEFDSDKPTKLEGLVTKVEWMNPHVWFYMDVTDDATGEVVNWGFEMGAPHQLQRRGWGRNTMTIGNQLIVEGSLSRDGSPKVNARTVTTTDGVVLGAASSQAQTLGGGTNND